MHPNLESAVAHWIGEEVARQTDEHGTVWVVGRTANEQGRYDVIRCWNPAPLGPDVWLVSKDLHATDDTALISYLMGRA